MGSNRSDESRSSKKNARYDTDEVIYPGECKAEGVDLKLKYGQGSITKRTRQRKDGSTYFYYQGKFYDNNDVIYVTAKTKEDCYKKLKQLKKTDCSITTGKFTLAQWVEEFFAVYKQNELAATTLKNYKAIIKNHVPELLLNRKLKDVKAVELQQVINSVAEKFPRQARTVCDIFCMALREAWNNDYIKKDIAKVLKRPTVISQEETPLTAEQQQAIYSLPDKTIRNVLIAYIWSGCRRNELLDLKPKFWDKEKETLFIAGTKTATSKRTIPVLPPLKEILLQLPMDGETIFGISQKTLQRKKIVAEQQLGFKFTIKALRHTFNQNLTEMGVPDIVRAAWMGHSKPTTTKKTYTHLTENLQNEALNLIKKNLNSDI